mmetsp:Transcript_58864/g.167383  ORF Transcript_58864/g.167383 Transcript_58864/m.167383 type:complete len:290 (-) Transcript_58864:746-1615(-)
MLDVVGLAVRDVDLVPPDAVLAQAVVVQHHGHPAEAPVERQLKSSCEHVGCCVVEAHVCRVLRTAQQHLTASRISDGVEVLVHVRVAQWPILLQLSLGLLLRMRSRKEVVPLPRALNVAKALDGAQPAAGVHVPENDLAGLAGARADVVRPGVEGHAEGAGAAVERLRGTALCGIEVPDLQLAVPARGRELARVGGRGRELERVDLGGVRGENLQHIASLDGPDVDRVVPTLGAGRDDLASAIDRQRDELAETLGADKGPEVPVAQQVEGAQRAVLAATDDSIPLRRKT